jgi:PAS domain S-box-containing protein
MFVTGLISLLISLLIKKYIISSSSLIRDIEERQKVEDKLSKATAFYENVLNSISDPLFVKDENMHFKVVNEAYSDFIGIPQDKLLGRNYNIFINKKEEEAAQISDEIAMDEGRGIEIEERYTDKLGFTRTLQVKKSFLLLNSHKYLVGIMRDISSKATLEKEMTRLIKELQKANNDLKDLTKMKEDFIAIASHDLRAPFEGILGFSNLLLNSDEISEENKEMIRCIVQSAEGQLKYVNSLLEIMSFEKGNIKLSKSSVDINNLVSKSVDFLNILAKKKHITLEIIHTDIVNANVDEPKISQVLNNFITNAIKFTPEEGVIKVDVKIVDDIFFRVDVIDSGIGINKKNAALIFDKYKTLSEGTNGEQGTGLGLYICKLMIRAHGGEIGVLKNSLKGSDFYFTLPLY